MGKQKGIKKLRGLSLIAWHNINKVSMGYEGHSYLIHSKARQSKQKLSDTLFISKASDNSGEKEIAVSCLLH